MWFTPKEAFWVVDLIGFLLRRTSLLQLEDHQCVTPPVTPPMRSQVEEREEKEELYFWQPGALWNPDPLTPGSALGRRRPAALRSNVALLPHTALTGLIIYFNQWQSLSFPFLVLFFPLYNSPTVSLSLSPFWQARPHYIVPFMTDTDWGLAPGQGSHFMALSG